MNMTKQKTSATITERICAAVERDITAGVLQVGDKVPSVVKLMKKYDCSRITAALAIKQLQATGFVHTINGSGTYICPPPRRHKIVVLHPADLDPTFSQQNIATHQFLHGAGQACKNRFREHTLIDETYEDFLEHLDLAEVVYPGLRGVALFRGYEYVETIAAALDAKGIPWILYGSNLKNVTCRNRLILNETVHAEMAVDYLYAKGHERIGLVYFPGHLVHENIRRRLPQALARRGLTLNPQHVLAVRNLYGKDAPDLLPEFLANPDRPTALYCPSDSISVNVLTGLLMAGIKCPEEISVLGNESPYIENCRPALATLSHSIVEDGVTCVEQLVQAWNDPAAPIRLESQFRLIERDSVADLAEGRQRGKGKGEGSRESSTGILPLKSLVASRESLTNRTKNPNPRSKYHD